MRPAKLLPALLLVLTIGCASGSRKGDLTRAERTATCESDCAHLAFSLINYQLYSEAEPTLDRARKDMESEEVRFDVPIHPGIRAARKLELEFATIVLDKRLKRMKSPDFTRAVELTSELIETGATNLLELDFLPLRDRIWLENELRADESSDKSRLAYAVVLTSIGRALPRDDIDAIVQTAETTNELEAVAYVLCESDECKTPRAHDVIGKLIDLAVAAEDQEVRDRVLDSQAIPIFIREAGPQHASTIARLFEDHSKSRDVEFDVPQNAFSHPKSCDVAASALRRIITEAPRDPARLMRVGTCLVALGRSGFAHRILDRVVFVSRDKEERIAALELQMINAMVALRTRTIRSTLERLLEEGGKRDWQVLADAYLDMFRDDPPDIGTVRELPSSDARTLVLALYEHRENQNDQALRRFRQLKYLYRTPIVYKWASLEHAIGVDSNVGRYLEEIQYLNFYLRAQLLAMEQNWPEFDRHTERYDLNGSDTFHHQLAWYWADREGLERVDELLIDFSHFLGPKRLRRHAWEVYLMLDMVTPDREVLTARLEGTTTEVPVLRSSVSRTCPTRLVADEQKTLEDKSWADYDEFVKISNKVSWCHILSGRYEQGWETAPPADTDKDYALDTRAAAAYFTGRFDDAAKLWRRTKSFDEDLSNLSRLAAGHDVPEPELIEELAVFRWRAASNFLFPSVHWRIAVDALTRAGREDLLRSILDQAIVQHYYPLNFRYADAEAKRKWSETWDRPWPLDRTKQPEDDESAAGQEGVSTR